MRKQVVSVRLMPDVIKTADLYVNFIQEHFGKDHPEAIKTRSELIERALIMYVNNSYDYLVEKGYAKDVMF